MVFGVLRKVIFCVCAGTRCCSQVDEPQCAPWARAPKQVLAEHVMHVQSHTGECSPPHTNTPPRAAPARRRTARTHTHSEMQPPEHAFCGAVKGMFTSHTQLAAHPKRHADFFTHKQCALAGRAGTKCMFCVAPAHTMRLPCTHRHCRTQVLSEWGA